MSDERNEDQPGWAAPDLPPSAPAGSTPAPPPGAPVPAAPAPAAPPPVPPATPSPWTAQPAAGPSAPAAPVRKRRGWIIALVLVLGAILLTVIAGTVLFVDRALPPYNAADDFMHDLANSNVRGAEARLCSADHDNASAAIRTVTRHFVGGEKYAVNPLSVDRSGDTATVEYTITSRDATAKDHTYELPVVLEGDTWKVCPGAPLQ